MLFIDTSQWHRRKRVSTGGDPKWFGDSRAHDVDHGDPSLHSVFSLQSITSIAIDSNVRYLGYANEVGEGWVDSISNNGVAAGANSGANQYFMWTQETGNQFIGGVSPGNNVGGQASVSDNGSFICGSMLNALTGNHEAGLYSVQSETWTPLGGIGGSSGNSVSSGWGISGNFCGNTDIDRSRTGTIKYQSECIHAGIGCSSGVSRAGQSADFDSGPHQAS